MFSAGSTDCYAEIEHDEELNATTAFSWIMMIKPDSVDSGTKGVILEYSDGYGGIRLSQVNLSTVD